MFLLVVFLRVEIGSDRIVLSPHPQRHVVRTTPPPELVVQRFEAAPMGWIVGVDGKRVRRRGGSVGWDPYIHPWSEEARACGDVTSP